MVSPDIDFVLSEVAGMHESILEKARSAVSFTLPVALLVALAPGAWADQAAIARSYGEFNDRLRQAASRNPDGLREFHTERLSRSTAECFRDSNCRTSELAFLDVITMGAYQTVSYVETGPGSAEMGIVGMNVDGTETGLVVSFRFEEQRWRIDSIAKVPLNSSRLRR